MSAIADPPAEDRTKEVTIWHALLAFQEEAPVLPKDRTATVQTKNGQYTYSYTDLGTINEKIGPLLRKHGLVWTSLPGGTHEQPTLAYTLAHAPSGQTITGVMPLFGVDSSQSHGSAQTYGRRYSKVDVLDLVADEDDDGQAATFHRESRAAGGGQIDMRDYGKGLRDEAINAARESMGWPKLEKPWGSLVNVPADRADEFKRALDAARAAQ